MKRRRRTLNEQLLPLISLLFPLKLLVAYTSSDPAALFPAVLFHHWSQAFLFSFFGLSNTGSVFLCFKNSHLL